MFYYQRGLIIEILTVEGLSSELKTRGRDVPAACPEQATNCESGHDYYFTIYSTTLQAASFLEIDYVKIERTYDTFKLLYEQY
jgi:hypothetical protein